MISFPLLPRSSRQRWYELRMAHDTVDTSVRSRRLNGVTGAAIDKNEQNKGNGNGVPSLAVMSHSATECAEVKSTTQNGVHSNTNNNDYRNGRKEETCNEYSVGDAQPAATADYRLSLMRGPLLHDNVPFIPQFRWPDLIVQIFLHAGAIYGLLFQFYSIKFYTLIWCKLNFTIQNDIHESKANHLTSNIAALTHFHMELWTENQINFIRAQWRSHSLNWNGHSATGAFGVWRTLWMWCAHCSALYL